jgi:hypothetical protein
MKRYHYSRNNMALSVFEQSHSEARHLGLFPTGSKYRRFGVANAILRDARGNRVAAEHWRTFAEYVQDHMFIQCQDITSDEISVWLSSQRDKTKAEGPEGREGCQQVTRTN